MEADIGLGIRVIGTFFIYSQTFILQFFHRFDYDRPSYYRRYYDPTYNYYLRSSYYPYRSYLLDSMTDSLMQGLHMFRKGVITYGQLNHNWLTPSWDKTFKNYRDLYLWDTEKNYGPYIPSYYNRKARSQSVSWVS